MEKQPLIFYKIFLWVSLPIESTTFLHLCQIHKTVFCFLLNKSQKTVDLKFSKSPPKNLKIVCQLS